MAGKSTEGYVVRIYLSSRFGRKEEMRQYARELRIEGYTVDVSWLDEEAQGSSKAQAVESAGGTMPMVAREFAENDYDDVHNADVLIAFTEHPDIHGGKRGGRHVEVGMALAWGTNIIVVGPRENIFHTMEHIQHCDEWGQAVFDILETITF